MKGDEPTVALRLGLWERIARTDIHEQLTSAPRTLSADVADATEALVGPPERRSANSQVKGEAQLSAANTQGPRERSRHHRGLALGSQALRGLRLGAFNTASTKIVLGAAVEHSERNHVAGIAMQIPRDARKENTIHEKRVARLFGLTLDGPFAISLILSAITI